MISLTPRVMTPRFVADELRTKHAWQYLRWVARAQWEAVARSSGWCLGRTVHPDRGTLDTPKNREMKEGPTILLITKDRF